MTALDDLAAELEAEHGPDPSAIGKVDGTEDDFGDLISAAYEGLTDGDDPEDWDDWDKFQDAAAFSTATTMLGWLRDVTPALETREDWPHHQPAAPDAPIPGRQWWGGCDPDLPRVRPDGVCVSCGGHACPECGHEPYPDGGCGCPR